MGGRTAHSAIFAAVVMAVVCLPSMCAALSSVRHWKVTHDVANLDLDLKFSGSAAVILALGSVNADFNGWDPPAAHAQTPFDNTTGDATQSQSQSVAEFLNYVRMQSAQLESMLAGCDVAEALFRLGFALHAIQDLSVHEGITNPWHAYQTSIRSDPDSNPDNISRAKVWTKDFLLATKTALGEQQWERLRMYDGPVPPRYWPLRNEAGFATSISDCGYDMTLQELGKRRLESQIETDDPKVDLDTVSISDCDTDLTIRKYDDYKRWARKVNNREKVGKVATGQWCNPKVLGNCDSEISTIKDRAIKAYTSGIRPSYISHDAGQRSKVSEEALGGCPTAPVPVSKPRLGVSSADYWLIPSLGTLHLFKPDPRTKRTSGVLKVDTVELEGIPRQTTLNMSGTLDGTSLVLTGYQTSGSGDYIHMDKEVDSYQYTLTIKAHFDQASAPTLLEGDVTLAKSVLFKGKNGKVVESFTVVGIPVQPPPPTTVVNTRP